MMDLKKWYGDQDPSRDYRPAKAIISELVFLGCTSNEARLVAGEVVRLRGGSSRRDILIQRYRDIMVENLDELLQLPRTGVRGGVNVYRVPGWTKSPNIAISAAVKKTDSLLWANGWSGGGKTPDTWIPKFLEERLVEAWKEVYLG